MIESCILSVHSDKIRPKKLIVYNIKMVAWVQASPIFFASPRNRKHLYTRRLKNGYFRYFKSFKRCDSVKKYS